MSLRGGGLIGWCGDAVPYRIEFWKDVCIIGYSAPYRMAFTPADLKLYHKVIFIGEERGWGIFTFFHANSNLVKLSGIVYPMSSCFFL